MKTYEYQGEPLSAPRSHPWTTATADSAYRYYDLTKDPARIRRSLEDFLPWNHHAATELFYSLLEWLHQPSSTGQPSVFESNDCAFTGPHENDAVGFSRKLQCTGRVMLLYRDLALNRSQRRWEECKNALHRSLQLLDTEFQWGVVATTILPVDYLALPVRSGAPSGYQLMISFWAWGDDEVEVMTHLDRVLGNLFGALREVVRRHHSQEGAL